MVVFPTTPEVSMLVRSIGLLSMTAALILPTMVHANDQAADPFEA